MTRPSSRPDAVFSALADPTRRDVLSHLAQSAATATELAATVPVSRQAVVKHLQSLGAAGLVTSAREGREVRYHLEAAPLTDAVAWMCRIGGEWDQRLHRLRRQLESPTRRPRT